MRCMHVPLLYKLDLCLALLGKRIPLLIPEQLHTFENHSVAVCVGMYLLVQILLNHKKRMKYCHLE